ncbi:MAG TPA: Glu/Leu/Phe/Val dehydrogenase dimerization domain-containing protein [Actinomycetota bacterium]|nr:Glu/Leu/Phe/Val dehydrogenase dimerization domain-containing protein [Actinomycetota bacterium]
MLNSRRGRPPDARSRWGSRQGSRALGVFSELRDEYEEVVHFHDPPSGLKAIVAIHSTALGPSLGGTRFFPFRSEDEALRDVLRLARGMTYKAAAAGLDLGGGKAVIIGDPRRDKSEELLRAYGRFIESLDGRYITAEDVGTSREDMDVLRRETSWVTGVSKRLGGSGDPSPVTAYGVFQGLRACAEEALGTSSLEGVRVVVQGVGKVGYHLVKHLVEEGAAVTVADVDVDAVGRVVNSFGVETAEPDKAHAVASEIFAPCALGAVIRDDTLPELKCKVVAGAANNQLERPEHGDALQELGILYAPDFVINAGGLINVADELIGYDRDRAMAKVEGIYRTVREVFRIARTEGVTPAAAANALAERRMAGVSRVRLLWLPAQHRPPTGRR